MNRVHFRAMRLSLMIPALLVAACLPGAEELTSADVLARAEALADSGKREQAIELLTAWTGEHPDDTAARRRLLNLQVAAKEAEIRDLVRQQADERDLLLADQEYENARARASDDVQRRLRAAEYLITQGRHPEALESVNRILRDHPDDNAALRMKSRLLDHVLTKQREALARNRANAREEGLQEVTEKATFPGEKPRVKREVFVFDEDMDELARAQVSHRLQERIDLIMDKAKVGEVMERLFKVAGINYVVLDSAIGEETVTLNLKNDTIESALEAVGKLAQVRFAYNRGTVFVSNDANENLVTEIIRLKSGLTNVEAAATAGSFSGGTSSDNSGPSTPNPNNPNNPNPSIPRDQRTQRAANTATNTQAGNSTGSGDSDLEKFINKVPEIIVGWPSDGKVYLDRKSNSLFVRSTPWGISELKRLLHAMDYNSVQVLIQARFIEVQESALRELGVDWGGQYGANPASPSAVGTFGLIGGNPTALTSQQGNADGGIITGVISSGKLGIKATITALENQGKSDTLAEPKILALNNQQGLIEITKSTPYIANYTTQSYNNNAISNGNGGTIVNQTVVATPVIETVESGYQLKIRPSIARNSDVITLHLSPTIRDLVELQKNEQGFTGPDGKPKTIFTPILSQRTIDTTLHIKNGQSVAMGGLIKERDDEKNQSTPFLSSIPVIGSAFKHERKSNERSNLIIIVSADIVDPSGAKVGEDVSSLRDTARILLTETTGDQSTTAVSQPSQTSTSTSPAPAPAGRPTPAIGPANYRGR